jgi:hypothetical protein
MYQILMQVQASIKNGTLETHSSSTQSLQQLEGQG